MYELNRLKNLNNNSNNNIFIKFAKLLRLNCSYIIKSFVITNEGIVYRISNEPIEGFNRKLKKKLQRSLNFQVARVRIIWSTKRNCPYKR